MDLSLEVKPFLSRLAEQISEEVVAEKSMLIVLPNRRSQFVLQGYLSKLLPEDNSVELRTVDQLMEELSSLKMIDPEELLVAFYSAYSKSEKSPQSFDQFSSWAASFLTDVNDVDLNMGNMDELLKQINDYHTTGEYFSDGSPGPMERDYLTFWQRLPKYYKALKTELSTLKLAYRGLIYRNVAETFSQIIKSEKTFFSSKTIFWVGVIPGNPSEQLLLKWLKENGELEVFADVDQYYVNNTMHEAGKLFRSGTFAHETNWKVNLLARKPYEIKVHPMPSSIGQLTETKRLLEQIPAHEYRNTVVILANEKLLSPFLELFSDWRDRLNITTGYPLRNTLIHRFVMSWIQMHAGALRRNNDVLFYYKHIEEFLEYAIIKNWIQGSSKWASVKETIIKRNMKFVSKNWLEKELNQDLFADKAFHLLFDWPEKVTDIFQLINDVLADWRRNVSKTGLAPIEVQALPVYIQKLKLLLSQFNELLPESDLKALRKFVHRQVGYSKIYLEEPENECIQVMGMLESRMIDFKHVIVVGASDDTLPGSPNKPTHIPFIHRVNYGLPTPKETEALIAYHFYRLIQRADHIHLVYCTTTTAFNGGEVTRYVLQLKEGLAQENDALKLEKVFAENSFDLKPAPPLLVKKTPEVMADLEQALKRLSPSAINKFINSPLEFYYSYVLRLKEQDKVEEDVEASTFGSVVHDSIEKLYTPLVGKTLTEHSIKPLYAKVEETVIGEFENNFDPALLQNGKNKVQVELAKNWVKLFIEFDAADIKENGPIDLIALELRLGGDFAYKHLSVTLNSFADRVDKRNGIVRIVDYKTGKVESKDLVATWLDMREKMEKSKALQLAFYAWAYGKNVNIAPEQIESVIFSFRNKREGYLPLVLKAPKGEELPTFKEGFEKMLTDIFDEMFDTSQDFAHRETSKYMNF